MKLIKQIIAIISVATITYFFLPFLIVEKINDYEMERDIIEVDFEKIK